MSDNDKPKNWSSVAGQAAVEKARKQYKPGNIIALVENADVNDMEEAEHLFVQALHRAKKSMLQTLEDRVDEINRLMAGIGGFSSQLKSNFARSTVTFLEQDDPDYTFRERLIFSINLPNYELKHRLGSEGFAHEETEEGFLEDGRTPVQATWDEAVNALAKIIESTGLKPKYVKNDRHYGRFTMKQDLRSAANLPDEYFSFTLDYNNDKKIEEMKAPYDDILDEYDDKIEGFEKKLAKHPKASRNIKVEMLKTQLAEVMNERDLFAASTPDPHNLEEGLLFLIEVSTLKDYHIVKDRMQTIMTKYILHLSKIAEKDAQFDEDMQFQLKRTQRQLNDDDKEKATREEETEGVREFLIDARYLEPAPRATTSQAATEDDEDKKESA